MARKKYRRKQNLHPILPITIGLFLIGIALIWLALSSPASDAEEGEQRQSSRASSPLAFPAPALSLENLNGETKSLAEYRQHVVLLNNWATWCPPCKAEMPVLESYYEEHANEGFMIIAVEAGDGKDGVMQFAQRYQLKFQVWLDPHNESLKAFGNGNLPNSYIIDRQGTVRYAWTGEINRATLDKYITPLLTE